MSGKICPSMMCADIGNLKETLQLFQKEKIEYLHIDVMDGCFVPNLQLGTDFIKQLRKLSDIPLDIHLMITQPEYKLEWFDFQPGEYVSVHAESTPHIHRAMSRIRDIGAKPMLALNPGTPIDVIDEVIPDIDAILLMTVNPGFAGQKMIPQMLDKIRKLKNKLDAMERKNIEIEVDGNVSFPNAEKMAVAGADLFVAGTASIFTKEMNMTNAIRKLRECI